MTATEHDSQTLGEQVLERGEVSPVAYGDFARPLLEMKLTEAARIAVIFSPAQQRLVRDSIVKFARLSVGDDELRIPDIIAGESLVERIDRYIDGLLEVRIAAIRTGADDSLHTEHQKAIETKRIENLALQEELDIMRTHLELAHRMLAYNLDDGALKNFEHIMAIAPLEVPSTEAETVGYHPVFEPKPTTDEKLESIVQGEIKNGHKWAPGWLNSALHLGKTKSPHSIEVTVVAQEETSAN